MLSIVLFILILILLAPALGIYVVAGTLGLVLKILLVLLIVGLIINLLPASGTRGRWW